MTRYAVRQFYKRVSHISRGAYPKWGTGSVPCHGFTLPYPCVVYPLFCFALHSGPLCASHGLLFLLLFFAVTFFFVYAHAPGLYMPLPRQRCCPGRDVAQAEMLPRAASCSCRCLSLSRAEMFPRAKGIIKANQMENRGIKWKASGSKRKANDEKRREAHVSIWHALCLLDILDILDIMQMLLPTLCRALYTLYRALFFFFLFL